MTHHAHWVQGGGLLLCVHCQCTVIVSSSHDVTPGLGMSDDGGRGTVVRASSSQWVAWQANGNPKSCLGKLQRLASTHLGRPGSRMSREGGMMLAHYCGWDNNNVIVMHCSITING